MNDIVTITGSMDGDLEVIREHVPQVRKLHRDAVFVLYAGYCNARFGGWHVSNESVAEFGRFVVDGGYHDLFPKQGEET